MSGSCLDGVLTGLVPLWTAAAADGWEVIDGRPFDPRQRKILAVGWAGIDQPAAAADRGIGDFGLSQSMENFDIVNRVSVWAGDKLTPAVRSEALAGFDLFDAALTADPTVGGSCMLARVSQMSYTPARYGEGVHACVDFTVAVKASQ